MQVDNNLSRQIQKIENKLVFLNDALNFDLSQEQKNWIEIQSITCNELAKTIKSLDRNSEYVDRLAEDLYNNLRGIKRKVVAWLKFNKTDVQTFKDLKKRKGQTWVPLIDVFPYPAKSSEISDADLRDINFPCLSYTNKELCQFSERILIEHNILNELNITAEKLNTLVEKICNGYNAPAYHNFAHGFSVFQTLHYFFRKTETQMPLDKIEKFSSLIGGLGHDLNHNGFNNAYEVKVKSENSIHYCDKAPLENMHASRLITILKDPEINFFEWFWDPKDRVRFQELAVTLILATDMAQHNKQLVKFTNRVQATIEYQKLKNENEPISQDLEEKALLMDRPADKKTILGQVIHACDFTNTCQKYDNYMYWAALLAQEFDYQAKKEKDRGVEVSVFLIYKDKPSFHAGQLSFAKNLSFPLWEQIVILFGSVGETVENLNENFKRLEEGKDKPAEEK